jgi:hypothetical protein
MIQAAEAGHVDIVKLFLDAGASVKAETKVRVYLRVTVLSPSAPVVSVFVAVCAQRSGWPNSTHVCCMAFF